MPNRTPAVYILCNRPHGTLYIGVTSDPIKRIWEHRNNMVVGFTRQYGVHRLVYMEQHETMADAILREKRLKKWRRAWKVRLIEEQNPDWLDLWEQII